MIFDYGIVQGLFKSHREHLWARWDIELSGSEYKLR